MEGRGEGAGFFISTVAINTFIGFRSVPQVHCGCLQVNRIKVLLFYFVGFIFRSGGFIDL